jgi:hypothetical protein
MQAKPLRVQYLEKELSKERERHDRTKRAFDGLVGERNTLEHQYINLKDDYANLARLKVDKIIRYMSRGR